MYFIFLHPSVEMFGPCESQSNSLTYLSTIPYLILTFASHPAILLLNRGEGIPFSPWDREFRNDLVWGLSTLPKSTIVQRVLLGLPGESAKWTTQTPHLAWFPSVLYIKVLHRILLRC